MQLRSMSISWAAISCGSRNQLIRTDMDSTKTTKTFSGTVYEGKEHYLLQHDDTSKQRESIQYFVDRMLMDYNGQKVTVKVSIDIDVQ